MSSSNNDLLFFTRQETGISLQDGLWATKKKKIEMEINIRHH